MTIHFTANVEITSLHSRGSIDYPGNTFLYNCSIQSNSEALYLTWRVTTPGETINITYPNSSENRTNLNNYITTSLTGYKSDEFIHSTLEIMVNQYTPTHQIMIECSIAELGFDSISFQSSEYGIAVVIGQLELHKYNINVWQEQVVMGL